jgi:hypothetical protein
VEENTFLRDYAMKQLEATIKDWPEEVKAFDPGKKASLQARLGLVGKEQAPGGETHEPATAAEASRGV